MERHAGRQTLAQGVPSPASSPPPAGQQRGQPLRHVPVSVCVRALCMASVFCALRSPPMRASQHGGGPGSPAAAVRSGGGVDGDRPSPWAVGGGEMHREMLASAASKLHRHDLWTRSPETHRAASPAPYEPATQLRSPEPMQLDASHLARLELEARALENHRHSSLVTRAALQDAMRVLDENRALKQQLAHAEGKLMSSEQEGEALREMLAADRAAMRSQQAEMHRKITALELQVAELLNSRECLREEVGILRRHCYLISSPSPGTSRSPAQSLQSAERASAGVLEGGSGQAGGTQGALSRSHVVPAQAATLCAAYGIHSSAELEAVLSAHRDSHGMACASAQPSTHGGRTGVDVGGGAEVYSVKGVVERVSLGMPWPKSSASPMVLPLDSAGMWEGMSDRSSSKGPPNISRMPSAESRTSEPFEVELSDDTDSGTPGAASPATYGTASPAAASLNLPRQRSFSSDSCDDGAETPMSTSATIPRREFGAKSSAGVRDSSGALMWGGPVERDAGARGEETSVIATTPAGGLDLKRGKPSAVRSPTVPTRLGSGRNDAAAVHARQWRQVCGA